jgi:hypothetical protein
MRSTGHSTTRGCAGRLVEIGGTIPAKAKRGRQPLASLVKSEIARWTPIIEAAIK